MDFIGCETAVVRADKDGTDGRIATEADRGRDLDKLRQIRIVEDDVITGRG